MAQKKLTSITDMTDFKYPLDYAIASIGGTLGKISGDALKDYYTGLADGTGAETAIARSEAAAVAISEAQETLDAAAQAIGAEDEEDMEDIIAYAGVHTDGSNSVANAWMERLGYGCLIFTTTEENEEVYLTAMYTYFDAIYADGKAVELTGDAVSDWLSSGTTFYLLSYTFAEAGDHAVWVKVTSTRTTFTNCFYGCEKMTKVAVTPFRLCTAATNFANLFNTCCLLASVPSGMFDNCTLVTNFSNMFNRCEALTEAPDGLFANHYKVTNFRGLFANNSVITRAAVDFHLDVCTNFTNITLISGCPVEVITIYNLGAQEDLDVTDAFTSATSWGSTDEGLESLVDSLLTNSFDRATAGYDALTITLPSAVYARLSDDEVNSIVAKGFTLAT